MVMMVIQNYIQKDLAEKLSVPSVMFDGDHMDGKNFPWPSFKLGSIPLWRFFWKTRDDSVKRTA